MSIRWVVFLALTGVGAVLLPPPAVQAEPDVARIEAAANRAVQFLKNNQKGLGIWYHTDAGDLENNTGVTALVGLALMESGIPRDDPMLKAAYNNVRNAAPQLKRTYPICLAILFLDRYMDHKEFGLVRTLALRLAAGQNQGDGGWSYTCPTLSAAQEKYWMGELKRFQNVKDFGKMQPAGNNAGDNSNTQFAVLAMWIARNHGLPVEYPLFKAEWRFRETQGGDGGWNYTGAGGGAVVPTTPSMTCAGMLGLAVAFGAKQRHEANLRASKDKIDDAPLKPSGAPRKDMSTDSAVIRAKEYIAQSLRRPQRDIPHYMYFLWSMERVAVTYKFTEFGGVDWYDYGSSVLIQSQNPNGSWSAEDSLNVDTCFALLFLHKADLVDLSGTASLRADGKDGKAAKADPLGGGLATGSSGKTEPAKELPKDADAAKEAEKLLAEFPSATPSRQQDIIDTLQDTKDPSGSFTQALLDLIPKVKDNLQVRVRSALAERLARQTLETLRKRLADEDMEIRIAAAKAMGMKKTKDDKPDTRAMPDLMKLLKNSNEQLASAAEESLRALTQQDLGRNPERWQAYYDKLPLSRR